MKNKRKRGFFEKTYMLEYGIYKIKVYSQPIHYLDTCQ